MNGMCSTGPEAGVLDGAGGWCPLRGRRLVCLTGPEVGVLQLLAVLPLWFSTTSQGALRVSRSPLRVVVATSRQVCRSRVSDDEEYAILGPRPGVHWARVQGHRETCPAAREACLKRQPAAGRCRVVSTLHACDALSASSLLPGPLDDSPSSRRQSRSERWREHFLYTLYSLTTPYLTL